MKSKQIIKLLKKLKKKCIKLNDKYGSDSCQYCMYEELCNALYDDAPRFLNKGTLEILKEEIEIL